MAMYRLLGKWLDKSGWTSVMAMAEVASPGVAEAFISANHVTRARRAHQITAASLHVLRSQLYSKYLAQHPSEGSLTFEEWQESMSSKYPQFLYWSRVLELELCCLQVVKAALHRIPTAVNSMDVRSRPNKLRQMASEPYPRHASTERQASRYLQSL